VVEQLKAIVGTLEAAWADWSQIRISELVFAQQPLAQRVVVVLIGVALAMLALRLVVRTSASRGRVALPALVGFRGVNRTSLVRHAALVLALAGLPFFVMALADPRTAVTREEVSYPGRRISLMIDASSSMLTALPANRFAEGAPNNAAFFSTLGAAR
jgi:hypothetical protein